MGLCHSLTESLPASSSSSVPQETRRIMPSHRAGMKIKCNKAHRRLSTVPTVPCTWYAVNKCPLSTDHLRPRFAASPNCTAIPHPQRSLLNLPIPASSHPEAPTAPEPASLHHSGLRAEHFHGNNLLHKRYSKYLLFFHTFLFIWV